MSKGDTVFKFFFLIALTNFSVYAGPGSLGEALSQRGKTFSEKMPKEVFELYQNNIKDMQKAGISKKALKVGDKAPDVKFTVSGEELTLKELYSTGPVVLKFYRGGWCPYCMTELRHYDQMIESFNKVKGKIVALSPDTFESSNKTRATNELSFDVLSDPDHAVARKFGLVYKLDQKVVDQLKKDGIDISVYQGNDKSELSIPATYVIGKDGRISFSFVDVDYRKRAEPETVLEAVKAASK